jgi:hypothetical protein
VRYDVPGPERTFATLTHTRRDCAAPAVEASDRTGGRTTTSAATRETGAALEDSAACVTSDGPPPRTAATVSVAAFGLGCPGLDGTESATAATAAAQHELRSRRRSGRWSRRWTRGRSARQVLVDVAKFIRGHTSPRHHGFPRERVALGSLARPRLSERPPGLRTGKIPPGGERRSAASAPRRAGPTGHYESAEDREGRARGASWIGGW